MALSDDVSELVESIASAYKTLEIEKKIVLKDDLHKRSLDKDFWNDASAAGASMQELNQLEELVFPWASLKKDTDDLLELSKLNDDTLGDDITEQLASCRERFEDLKKQLRFSGAYDSYDVLMGIYAGAGGTDAQDWTQMLLRMYTRWCETNGLKVIILEDSPGEEAGLKSVSLQISGMMAYGKLKGEHGVHRLVRLSPFNADAKRQTSFAKVEILPKIDKPEAVPIDDADLKIDVFRAGGHGGQSVNTTDSAVRVTHIPTGITVSIQNERSQLQNKETALTILRSKLAQLQIEQHLESLAELKGPNQSAEWGNQIRSYVLHPYTMVKDLRSRYETTNAQAVLDGDLNPFIDAYHEHTM